MKAGTLLISCLFCLSFAPCAEAQVTAEIESQPTAPIQITSAECVPVQTAGSQCKASVQFASKGLWTAYGIKWTLTYQNGRTQTLSTTHDRSLGSAAVAGAFKPGEVVDFETGAIGFRFNGNDIPLATAVVRVDFVIPAVGPAWGDMKSPNYQKVMATRRGFSQAMDYLRQVYKNQGAAAMHKALGVQ